MIRQGDDAPSVPVPTAGPLLPPRPNLGPEPWRSPTGSGLEWLVLIVVLLLMVAGVGVLRWRGRRRGAGNRAGSPLDPRSSGVPGAIGDRRVSRAETLRNALIAAFGPAWGAKTTEEIAEEPDLAARIGPERAEGVVSLLVESDRAKFSGGGSEGEPSGDEERLDLLLSDLIAVLKASKRGPEAEARGPSDWAKRRGSSRSLESKRA